MTSMKKMALAAAVSTLALSQAPTVQAQAGTEYIAQTTMFGFSFCPRGWVPADGQLLPIAQYTAVFSIVGTTYGGDGRTTFGVPDLRGRTPIGEGQGPGLPRNVWGEKGGSTGFALNSLHLPSHNHTGTLRASTAVGDSANPNNKALAVDASGDRIYHTAGATNDMAAGILKINNTGSNQAVNKVSPYLSMTWCFSLQGLFPSRN